MKNFYILTKITGKQGKLNNSQIYTLTFVDNETLQEYECVVDTTYRNYTRSRWNEIIDGEIYGCYSNLKRSSAKTSKGKEVINADSYPVLEERETLDTINEYIKAKRKAINKQKLPTEPTTQFATLFEFME